MKKVEIFEEEKRIETSNPFVMAILLFYGIATSENQIKNNGNKKITKVYRFTDTGKFNNTKEIILKIDIHETEQNKLQFFDKAKNEILYMVKKKKEVEKDVLIIGNILFNDELKTVETKSAFVVSLFVVNAIVHDSTEVLRNDNRIETWYSYNFYNEKDYKEAKYIVNSKNTPNTSSCLFHSFDNTKNEILSELNTISKGKRSFHSALIDF